MFTLLFRPGQSSRIAALSAVIALLPLTAASGYVRVQSSGMSFTVHTGGGPTQAATSARSMEVRNAQHEITRILGDLNRNFAESQALKDARTDLLNASSAYEAACTAATATIVDQPDYRVARERVLQAERNQAELRQNDKTTPQQFEANAYQLLNARMAVSKMEAAALADSADVTTAHDAWQAAFNKLLDVQRDFQTSIQSSADFRAAKSRLENARRNIGR